LTGLPAGAYGSGNVQMEAEFGISQDNFPWLYWATASWNVGAAVFPLLFVPLTENTGRMPGYFGAYILFLVRARPNFVSRFILLTHSAWTDLAHPFCNGTKFCDVDRNSLLRRRRKFC